MPASAGVLVISDSACTGLQKQQGVGHGRQQGLSERAAPSGCPARQLDSRHANLPPRAIQTRPPHLRTAASRVCLKRCHHALLRPRTTPVHRLTTPVNTLPHPPPPTPTPTPPPPAHLRLQDLVHQAVPLDAGQPFEARADHLHVEVRLPAVLRAAAVACTRCSTN